jgi:hypothetical protein
MSTAEAGRPIERRMLKWAEAGATDVEIAWRFRRTPKGVRQVMALAQLPGRGGSQPTSSGLRPIERRVLRLRDEGVDIAELASRFRRRPGFLEQVERMARHKLAR